MEINNTPLYATANKTQTPKLRFKEFGGEWKSKMLDDIADINPSTKNLPDKFIYIDLESVVKGQLLKETEILKNESPSRAQRYLQKDDILFQMVRPYQMNNLFFSKDGMYVASTGYAQIRTKENPKFVYQYLHLQKFVDKVIERCTGTSYPAINSSDLGKIKISIPTLPEQQKIATFLSAVDKKLQLLSRKKELLEKYKKGVMQQIFSGKLRFKDEFGQDYADWEEKRLGDVGDTFNGLTGKTKENFGIGKPYIQYMQIFASSKIDVSKCGLVQIDEFENQQRVQYGDVFFTTSSETPNEIGTCSVLLEEIEEMYLNSFCFGFRPNSLEQLVPDFASYLFRNENFRKKIVKLAQGSTRYNMSKVQLLKLKVKLPSTPEQQKIATFLSALDSKIEGVDSQIAKTQSFKKGLLQGMFV